MFAAWSCGGTQCYLVTARGVDTLLSTSRPIRVPVDGYLGRLTFDERVTVYALDPMPVRHLTFRSTIR